MLSAASGCREIDMSFDLPGRTAWCWMRPVSAPSFTPGMLREMMEMRRLIQEAAEDEGGSPVDWLVGGSRLPGIFNLGGDLTLFAGLIRQRAEEALTRYAHQCVDLCFDMTAGLDLPVVTIGLVQGQALGGGFECAMSFNVVVAERSASFGLPEILFNLFPGMGAYSYLSRRLDGIRAERMILSGRVFEAGELHELGLVDLLVDDGHGEEAVRDFIAANRARHPDLVVGFAERRTRQKLTREELRDVTEIWVQAALRLTPADLRKMERLVAAQSRRLGTP